MEIHVDVDPAWWMSWYNKAPLDDFELHSPWWISGERVSDGSTILVAAVRAPTEAAAWSVIRAAYDFDPGAIEQRFIALLNGPPFTEGFPRKEWMAWEHNGQTCGCVTHIVA